MLGFCSYSTRNADGVDAMKLISIQKTKVTPNTVWLNRQLLKEHFTGTTGSVIANIVNTAILMVIFWNSAPAAALFLPALIMGALLAWRIKNKKAFAQKNMDAAQLTRLIQTVEYNAALIGAWWGASVAYFMHISTLQEQVLCTAIGSGMMASGALTHRTLRRAGILFVGFAATGCIIAMLELGSAAGYAAATLVTCYAAVLFSSIQVAEKGIKVRYQRELELRESSETINMLLADFTEQGTDWVLEMDGRGCIINPSEQLAAASQRPVETLLGLPLVDLIDAGADRDQLADHLALGRAFRNYPVSLSIGKDRLWWTISARPSLENGGTFRGIVTDITAQRQAEDQVSYMAHFDSLTDLPNRFQFNQRLSRMLRDDRCTVGLMFLDLDQFKIINDTLGHSFGDLLLKGVARRLEACISSEEIVARLGGDEFAILFKNGHLNHMEMVGNKIINALTMPFRLDDHDVIVGTSIGLAISPDHGNESTSLLRNADLALYEAKAQGRNRQIVFQIGMDEAAQLRRALELDLRGALGKKELCLHYQPLVRIEDSQTLGYEALIRWEHPERGVVMPDSFIPIAEESGMIIPIGEWVIRQAIDDLTLWPEQMTVSINLSPAQMRSSSLITTLVHALAKTGADPKRVCIEITESVLMQDSAANLETLHKLHEIGVEIALDDFGTGYSSLNYLRSFPFDKIKIDRCFINEIDTREDCQAIVRSVVNLATSLGMTTTAEGVEREDQLEQLRLEGCMHVQGYLFSKAVPQDQLTDLRLPVLSHSQKLVHMESSRKNKKQKATLGTSHSDQRKAG
jgi:diguanylate cyclase (GGDEF)-like protein